MASGPRCRKINLTSMGNATNVGANSFQSRNSPTCALVVIPHRSIRQWVEIPRPMRQTMQSWSKPVLFEGSTTRPPFPLRSAGGSRQDARHVVLRSFTRFGKFQREIPAGSRHSSPSGRSGYPPRVRARGHPSAIKRVVLRSIPPVSPMRQRGPHPRLRRSISPRAFASRPALSTSQSRRRAAETMSRNDRHRSSPRSGCPFSNVRQLSGFQYHSRRRRSHATMKADVSSSSTAGLAGAGAVSDLEGDAGAGLEPDDRPALDLGLGNATTSPIPLILFLPRPASSPSHQFH